MRRIGLAALALTALLPSSAGAHGIWGHVHVTGWAVENMPDDELRQFLLEPEVFNALLFGAVFTDTGYAIDDPASRAYAEHAHWEPFVEDFVEWIRRNDPPPWDSLESRQRVAFLMGCASHGLQDSIFDSLFLAQVEERDGVGQDEVDPGTDGFLALDGYLRFVPEVYVPTSTLLELYEVLPEQITEEVIDEAVTAVTAAYVNDELGIAVAEALGGLYAEDLPWGREHYMDPEVPGSLRSEIFPTLRYQRALWARLHGELSADEVAIYAFPEQPRRLRSGDAATVDSWVSLIFGAGVRYEGDLAELLDDRGQVVPFTQLDTRWGAEQTRLIRLLPERDLIPGGWYTARMRAGAALIDGQTSTETWELSFQVACEGEGDPACPDLGEIAVASVDGLPEEEPAEDDVPAEGGCGCGSARGMPGPWALLLVGLATRRRRR